MDVWINKQRGNVCHGDKEKEEALPKRKQRRLPGGSDFAFKGPCICPSASVTPSAWKEETGDTRAGLQGLGSHGLPALREVGRLESSRGWSKEAEVPTGLTQAGPHAHCGRLSFL